MVHQRISGFGQKEITFMIVPHYTGKGFKLKVSERTAKIVISLLIIALLSFISAGVYSWRVTSRLVRYYGLMAEGDRQEKQLGYYQTETDRIKAELQDLKEREQELRSLLGLSLQPIKKSSVSDKLRNQVVSPEQLIKEGLAWVDQQAKGIEQSYTEMYVVAKDSRLRFAFTPSIMPIFGHLTSGFGWRRHPFTGRMEVHTGVDVPTWGGAPVKSTADGIVARACWLSGYGNAIEIDHGNGISTLYGHNNKLLVQKGDSVKKGQIIAEAGRTGLATGVHVHYEVRRAGKPVVPNGFLDLNIFTASRYWH
jgi:murein DD-endopeptidase MepM/ murein hydrolase activator NlpD